MEDEIKIDLGNIILIGKQPSLKNNFKSEFETKWLLIKNLEDKIFCLNSFELKYDEEFVSKIEKKYQIIDLASRIKGKIKTIINNELCNIYEENKYKNNLLSDYIINERVDYSTGEIIKDKEYEILTEAFRFGDKIRDDEYKTRYINLDISEISKGIISIYDKKVKYDVINDKFLTTDKDILNAAYSNKEIKLILLYNQYEEGIGSDFYNEIVKINNFIKDKQTIKVELKNGTIFKTEARLKEIIEILPNGDSYIPSTNNKKIEKGTKINYCEYKANEIRYLRFGKKELEINGEHLLLHCEEETEEFQEIEEGEI